ncbi:universal stress protein [Streptomyces bambusae]|uniref:universal stress protein n=1 Tax=Streptomyces bambusae TaxID=1550616 RepID=UPI001CFE494C|nr:universal stress protein [Streptomyces bambusae]MCB5163857.1 universal stress protein [Streptomyces bambusae]
MSNRITAGLDGSKAGLAAADWAAREAELRGAVLELVHADDWPQNAPFAAPLPVSRHRWADDLLAQAWDRVSAGHPGLDVRIRRIDGLAAATALASAAEDADLLVLGSRGLGPVAGFFVGSTGSDTIPLTETPVVLVRAAGARTSGSGRSRQGGPVVLGVDLHSDCERLLGFACEEADRHACPLVVVHGWSPPPILSYAPALDPGVQAEMGHGLETTLRELLAPWRQKYPQLTVDARTAIGQPAIQILDAASDAALVVVGRRIRHSGVGTHIGAITHAVMHHADAPVAVVAHA